MRSRRLCIRAPDALDLLSCDRNVIQPPAIAVPSRCKTQGVEWSIRDNSEEAVIAATRVSKNLAEIERVALQVQRRVVVAVGSSALAEAFTIDGKHVRRPCKNRRIEA